jgi:uncharacterized protein YecT (DUF1311 family)
VLIPNADTDLPDDDSKVYDYLVDVKAHRVLGVVKGAHFIEHRNHADLSVEWNPDSTWGVVVFDGRFGFNTVTLVEIKDGQLTQTDLGTHISKVTPNFAAAELHLRFSPERKLRVRAISTSDPKEMHPESALYGLFQGTFDLTSHRWTVEDGRKLSGQQYDLVERAYAPLDDLDTTQANLANTLSSLDDRLNSAYGALHILLPADRFAKLKAEQVAWLKQRDGAGSDEAKARLVHDRVAHLLDLLW